MMIHEIQALPTTPLACGHDTATGIARVGVFRAYECDECGYRYQHRITVTATFERRTFGGPLMHVIREDGAVVAVNDPSRD